MENGNSARVAVRFAVTMFRRKLAKFSTKSSRGLRNPAVGEPSFSDDLSNNTAEDAPAPEVIENTTLASPGLESASSWPVEKVAMVTFEDLKKIVKSSEKKKNEIRGLEDLVVEETKLAADALGPKRIKKLKERFPSLKRLTLRKLNLSGGGRDLCELRLRDLPTGLESLSLRESAFKPSSFFDGVDVRAMEKLRVLDLSWSTFVEGGPFTSITSWSKIESLRALYLEGALQDRSAASLGALLKLFPNLEVLSLERADLEQGDLTLIARLLPELRELYLGQTCLPDAAIIHMMNSEHRLSNVELMCLLGTKVTVVGLRYLVESCPGLRSVTGRRSTLLSKETRALEESFFGIEIKLIERSNIASCLRNKSCDHDSSRRNRRVGEPIELSRS